AAEYVALGKIAPEEATNHPQRHMLTRTLGLTRFIDVDVTEVELSPGDRILLCSDGLTEMVDDDAIAETLLNPTPDEATWGLIELANSAGGVDNVSVIVIDVLE
ncbi:MAG: SpoIIE family protein phosphatase, partial [Actinobacteria bacterium]|nr:SpoIIE family protein phosphatase [Actinomycetota bacterium]